MVMESMQGVIRVKPTVNSDEVVQGERLQPLEVQLGKMNIAAWASKNEQHLLVYGA